MNDATEKTLLPCPFCGGAPRKFNCVESDGFISGTFVRCDECGIDINDEYESGAVEAWNRRASPPAPAAESVAYQYRFKIDGEWTGWRVSNASQKSPHLKGLEERPLYTHPLDAATIRAEARREALEEAAKVCEDLAAKVLHPSQVITDRCAAAIRALADKGEAE